LRDPDTGEEFERLPLESLGMSYRKGRYYPSKTKREIIIAAFLIARWMADHRPQH